MKFVSKPLQNTRDVSRPRSSRRAFLVNTVILVLLFCLLMYGIECVGDIAAAYIPDSWERKLSSFELVDSDDQTQLQKAQKILDQLTAGEDLRDLNFHLYFIDHDEANAFAVVGGGIGLTRGLLESLKTEEGLAFVIAHELGHHQRKHTLRKLGSGAILCLVMSAISGSDSTAIVKSLMQQVDNSYSRSDELDADTFAFKLIHKKYNSTENAFEFFNLIQSKSKLPQWFAYGSTHPITKDRIQNLRDAEMR